MVMKAAATISVIRLLTDQQSVMPRIPDTKRPQAERKQIRILFRVDSSTGLRTQQTLGSKQPNYSSGKEESHNSAGRYDYVVCIHVNRNSFGLERCVLRQSDIANIDEFISQLVPQRRHSRDSSESRLFYSHCTPGWCTCLPRPARLRTPSRSRPSMRIAAAAKGVWYSIPETWKTVSYNNLAPDPTAACGTWASSGACQRAGCPAGIVLQALWPFPAQPRQCKWLHFAGLRDWAPPAKVT